MSPSAFDRLRGLKGEPQEETTEFKSEDRVSTGIIELDKLTKGGFKNKSLNLLIGGPGTGKTIFAAQFLVEGAKNGEKGMYISFGEKKEELIESIRSLDIELEKYINEGMILFVDYTPEQVDKVLSEGGGTFDGFFNQKGKQRFVFDSISAFLLLDDSDKQKKESILQLFKMIKEWEATSLIIDEEIIGDMGNKPRKSSLIEYETDSIILLYNLRVQMKDNRQRYLEIFKMRGTNHSLKAHEFIIGKKGIQLKTPSEVNKTNNTPTNKTN